MKICNKCGIKKDKNEFYKDKTKKDGFSNTCKVCSRAYNKTYYEKNKEDIKKRTTIYRETNKDKFIEYNKKYYENNKEILDEKNKIYKESNKERYSEYNKEYRRIHRNKLLARSRIHYIINKHKYTEIEKAAAEYKNYNYKLTVDESPKLAKDGVSLEVKCKYCGKYFIPTNKEVRNRINSLNGSHSGVSYLYCSSSCKKACPVYRQVKYPKRYKKESSREVDPLVRQLTFERDNWECQICGNTQKTISLHCHHIEGYTQNPILGNDIENCVTLCKECHKYVHKLPGCNYFELRCYKIGEPA